MEKPNILLIMADQMTAQALSIYGNRVCKTPNLENLAAQGVVFENAYCPYPLCSPSRFGLMSGRLPSRVKAYDNASEFPASVPTFSHYLRDAGYYTCISGKMHFIGPDQHHGYESRLTTEIYPADFSWTPLTYDEVGNPEDPACYNKTQGVSSVDTVADAASVARSMQIDYDEEVAQKAIQHIYDWKRYGDGRPLFMTVSFTQPHDPYVCSPEFWDLYSDEEMDDPLVPPLELSEMDQHSRGLYYHYGLDKCNVTKDVYRRARHGYYAMISFIDKKVGEIREALKAAGMEENTIVIFTSDHGDMVGERGLWFKKNLYEPAIHVPLIIKHLGNNIGIRRRAPVSLIDILPTLVDIAQGTTEGILTDYEGASLLPVIEKDNVDRIVYAEHIDGGTVAPRVMIRKGKFKLVYSLAYPPMLFNMEDDPQELRNIAMTEENMDVYNELLNLVNKTWDLEKLKRDVMADQKIRQFLARTLSKGKVIEWDSYPNPVRDSTRFVRRGEYFPEVERRSYLFFSPEQD